MKNFDRLIVAVFLHGLVLCRLQSVSGFSVFSRREQGISGGSEPGGGRCGGIWMGACGFVPLSFYYRNLSHGRGRRGFLSDRTGLHH